MDLKNSLGLNSLKKWTLIIVLGLMSFYYFISSSGIDSTNDSGHLALAISMYYDHQLSVEKYWQSLVRKPDYAVKDGIIYSDRLPGNALSIVPFLAYSEIIKTIIPNSITKHYNFKLHAAILFPILCGIIGLFLLFLICFKIFLFRFWESLTIMIIAGICTLNLVESTHLFSHAPSMMSVTLAVTIALFSKNSIHWKRNLYIISALIGYATIVELQNILFIAPLFFYITVVNNYKYFRSIGSTLKIISICSVVVGFFIGILLLYNYLAFDEIMLKSNKYNPHFKEEISFITALSGNLFSGLDNLFTSFNNTGAYFNWTLGIGNNTPGVFVANPILIFSALGFIPFFKKNKKESILFLSITIISVLIAALHVTTLVRHIFTIHILLFLPIIFFLDWIRKLPRYQTYVFYAIIVAASVISFLRQSYITNPNYKDGYQFGQFPYAENIPSFLILTLPVFIIFLSYPTLKNGLLKIIR